MSDNDTMRLGENDGALAGDALLRALRQDMQGLFGLVKGLDERIKSLDERVKSLDERVKAVDEKVDARLRDTTPMWEVVVSRLDTILAEQENQGRRLDAMEGRLDAIEAKLERFDAIDTELRHLRRRIERTIGELSTNVVGYRIDQHDLEDRIEKLEKTPA
jgi:chromosome segregation ATPase